VSPPHWSARRITKLGWFENDAHREIVDDATKFLESGSIQHLLLGLRLLGMVVSEVNHATPSRTLSEHRKTAVSFRDNALLKIFQLAVQYLRQLHQSGTPQPAVQEALVSRASPASPGHGPVPPPAGRVSLPGHPSQPAPPLPRPLPGPQLSLAQGCLSFDFVGTNFDESSEDLGAIQVPSSWRPLLEDLSLMNLLLDIYKRTAPPESATALDCLVRMASVRRSLFTGEAQRQKFISGLVRGSLDVLQGEVGLADHDNYHNFCRLLGRLKTNYQLNEIVSVDCYPDWIQLVAGFTVSSLKSWQWASGSVYYLLGLWSRLVSSVPYLKGDKPSMLDRFVPNIIEAYVTSRLESVATVLSGQATEDPLENEDQLAEQMDGLPYLCRFQYEKTAEYLQGILSPLVTQYQQMGQTGAGADQAAVLEGQLTWMCHVVGAIIKGRLNSSSAEAQEPLDGALASGVLTLLASIDAGFHATRYEEVSRQRLDVAILAFFQAFRKVYVGEQAMHTSKVYLALNEHLGLANHLAVLGVMLEKIAKNLQNYRSCEGVIGQTLELFRDLSDGYMSGKLLLKLDGAQFILANHTGDYFGFLKDPSNTRWRTMYYATLARLLFLDDSAGKFRAFVAPLHRLMIAIEGGGSTPEELRAKVPKESVTGLFRDLRGIVSATNSRRTYSSVFDWLYPRRFPGILRCLEAFVDCPDVTTPLLKFMSEFVLNKTQRLTFEASSPNGILLFREVSRVLVVFGKYALAQGNVADVYTQRYKGVWVCLTTLTRALSGNYVNFGVFGLYGDPALSDALSVALKMVFQIPLGDILAYRKVGKAFFSLLEVLCHNHTRAVAGQDPATFQFLLASIEAGLKSLDVGVSSQCASAADNLVSFYLNSIKRNLDLVDADDLEPPAEAQQLGAHFRENPGALPALLRTLLDLVLFEDIPNQWSLSRPILPLILLDEQAFARIKVRPPPRPAPSRPPPPAPPSRGPTRAPPAPAPAGGGHRGAAVGAAGAPARGAGQGDGRGAADAGAEEPGQGDAEPGHAQALAPLPEGPGRGLVGVSGPGRRRGGAPRQSGRCFEPGAAPGRRATRPQRAGVRGGGGDPGPALRCSRGGCVALRETLAPRPSLACPPPSHARISTRRVRWPRRSTYARRERAPRRSLVAVARPMPPLGALRGARRPGRVRSSRLGRARGRLRRRPRGTTR